MFLALRGTDTSSHNFFGVDQLVQRFACLRNFKGFARRLRVIQNEKHFQ